MSQPPDEEVGYGRPPKRTQFRRGQSGNPKGRPRGTTQSIQDRIIFHLGSWVEVNINGQVSKIKFTDAIARRVVTGAAKGDRHLIKFVNEVSQDRAEKERKAKMRAEELKPDSEILAEFLTRSAPDTETGVKNKNEEGFSQGNDAEETGAKDDG